MTNSSGTADGRARVAVARVRPEIESGRFPIKRTVGEPVRVTAWIHADGHDVLAAAVRYRPAGPGDTADWLERPLQPLGNDEWTAGFEIEQPCPYEYTVHGWIDRFATWRKELRAKHDAGQNVSSELLEGAALLRGVADRARSAGAPEDAAWLDSQADLVGGSAAAADRTQAALDDQGASLAARFPDLSHATAYDRVLTVSVDRERARFGSWYEMFPRSWGPDDTRSATFREAESHLPRIADLGFDIVYLPPIHPIGVSFRKGPGNTLNAQAGDPGSPWAIGSDAGGHKAVEPGLGTLDDFAHFVTEARRLGLEIALDLAFQCSPDHPYVREHPEWFRHRPDGTIKYAENPPKKYQDIYPFDFECDQWQALWTELKSVVEFWIARGVDIFRVDNPHTKPYRFWEWLIREIRQEHPQVLFLAEAFTRPKIMHYLAQLGFTQSYTYFTWKNAKDELVEYFTELTQTDVIEFYRPNLFANTPDILHAYLQNGGRPAFEIRLVLAAMLGATYGIYSGYELCENRAVPGSEEYLNSEKYQVRQWDWDRPGHIKDLVAVVNRIRRANPALQSDRSLKFCQTDNPQILAFSKSSPDGSNVILVVVTLDYANMQHGWVQVPLDGIDAAERNGYEVTDLLDGNRYTWRGERNYVRFDPSVRVAHVLRLPVGMPEIATATEQALAGYLPRQRWFAGKARTLASARLADWSRTGTAADGLMPAIAEVRFADGGTDRYFVPVAASNDEQPGAATGGAPGIGRTSRGGIVDALADDAACRALLDVMLGQRSIAMRHGAVRGTAHNAPAGAGDWPVIRKDAEQSNSSIVFGDRYLLKLLRRLEPGINPEIEILRFLTQRGFANIPPLAASLEYDRIGYESTSLAVLLEFVANQGTGWDRAVDDARRSQGQEQQQAAERAGDGDTFLESAATLGQRTAELHLALAADPADPGFAAEPAAAADMASLAGRLRRDLTRAMATLAERLESLTPSARSRASALLEARGQLEARINALADRPVHAMRTRVHGDYHLGQVLCAGDDFVIIDFEGEPARSLAERKAKQSPLKDVAGMLRSFSYAAYTALLTTADGEPQATEGSDTAARAWEAAVSAAFLDRYRQTMASAGLVPDDAQDFGHLLDAFLLEKAIYEVEYELASRPLWVEIPLLGILRLLNPPEELASAVR